MKTDNHRTNRAGRGVVVALAALQWLLLTSALGALVIYTDRSLEGLLGLHIEGGYAFFGALLIGILLGATIENNKALIAMTILCCAGAAAMFVAIILLPVWTNTIIGTTGLENFATTRALLYFGLEIIPVSMGALGGRMFGPLLPGRDLLADPRESEREVWPLDRLRDQSSSTSKEGSNAPGQRSETS
jgi:hypothetical protein